MKKWQEFMIKNGGKNKPIVKSDELKSLIRSVGIPPPYRPKVWMECCIGRKIVENRGYYEKLHTVHDSHQSDAQEQIDLDLKRTFPEHEFFQEESTTLVAMRRILIAYSWRNPLVAYCQSLNYIVAMLLLHYSEEEAFWMLVVVLEEILPANFYSPNLTGARAESRVLDDLVKDRLPKIWQHLQKLEVDTNSFCIGWFMRLYVGVLPLDATLRLWDILFNEGSKILLRTALSILKINEAQILKTEDFGSLSVLLTEKTREAWDETILLKSCFSFVKLTRGKIATLRKDYELIIREETRKMDEARKLYHEKKMRIEQERVDTVMSIEKIGE